MHRPALKRGKRGFTFAELLAAMVFLALVIPVALEGIAIANRASIHAERKSQALTLGENWLNEMILMDEWKTGSNQGMFNDGSGLYRWSLQTAPWDGGEMMELTLTVFFPVQGREYWIQLSTLADDGEDQ